MLLSIGGGDGRGYRNMYKIPRGSVLNESGCMFVTMFFCPSRRRRFHFGTTTEVGYWLAATYNLLRCTVYCAVLGPVYYNLL
jgi:hypothetical protein